MAKMKIDEFIEHVLINQIKRIQQEHGFHYISFSLIASGIEFLGACFSPMKFRFMETEHTRRSRFIYAILKLFPVYYHTFIDEGDHDLFNKFYSPMTNVLLPGSGIELIQAKEIDEYGNHLEVKNIRGKERLILVSEHLFTDFENACWQVVDLYREGKLPKAKMDNDTVLETGI